MLGCASRPAACASRRNRAIAALALLAFELVGADRLERHRALDPAGRSLRRRRPWRRGRARAGFRTCRVSSLPPSIAPATEWAPHRRGARRVAAAYFFVAGLPPAESGVAAIVAVKPGDDLVGLLLDERERHARDVGTGVGARRRADVGHDPAVGGREREAHVDRNLIDRDDRVHRRLRGDQPAQDEARAEALRRRQRGVGIIAEVCVDLRLRDLLADFLRRVRGETQRAQPRVDRLEMRAVVLLLRRDVAIALHLADDQHDLPALEVGAAGRGELRGDALLPRGLLLLRGGVRLRELEALRSHGARERQRRQEQDRDDGKRRHGGNRVDGSASTDGGAYSNGGWKSSRIGRNSADGNALYCIDTARPAPNDGTNPQPGRSCSPTSPAARASTIRSVTRSRCRSSTVASPRCGSPAKAMAAASSRRSATR